VVVVEVSRGVFGKPAQVLSHAQPNTYNRQGASGNALPLIRQKHLGTAIA
jgi:hypothetical protein